MSKKQKQWEDCTPAERRVLIAKDALASVVAGKYKNIFRGRYLDSMSRRLPLPSRHETATKAHCETIGEHCNMCARGALLLSRAIRFNSLTLADLGVWDRNVEAIPEETTFGLAGSFTERQLGLIEAAFEQNTEYAENVGFSDTIGDQAKQFGDDHPDHANRLIAILQNIIDHNGTFKPAVRYEVYER